MPGHLIGEDQSGLSHFRFDEGVPCPLDHRCHRSPSLSGLLAGRTPEGLQQETQRPTRENRVRLFPS